MGTPDRRRRVPAYLFRLDARSIEIFQMLKPRLIVASIMLLPVIASGAKGQWKPLPGLHRWSQIDRIPRHRKVARDGVPEPYRALRNPLIRSAATVARGEVVYAAHCAACHGATGTGDRPAGSVLAPAPFDLAWLSEMKVSRSDGFMYWTIAEGGAPVASSMPAFGKILAADDIWAVTTFIQANLPKVGGPRR
ncbi:MAG: hypothetical protein BGN95_08395 [Sphingomonas sp. 66-10]|nr:MAG: hypothetical protein BGN95_08395 [Sphingomonas sp. 66-10]